MSSGSILFQALFLLQQKENVRKAAQKTVHNLVQQAAQQAAQQLASQQAAQQAAQQLASQQASQQLAHKEREQCSLFILDKNMPVKFRVSSIKHGEKIKQVKTLRRILESEEVGGSPGRFVDYLNGDFDDKYDLSLSNLKDDSYLQMYWDITSRFLHYAGQLLSEASISELEAGMSESANNLGCIGSFLLSLRLNESKGFVCSQFSEIGSGSNMFYVKCKGYSLNLNLALGGEFGLGAESRSLAIPGALSVAGRISLDKSSDKVGVEKVIATEIKSDEDGKSIVSILKRVSEFTGKYCINGKLYKDGLGEHDEDKCDTTIKTLAQDVMDFSKQLYAAKHASGFLKEKLGGVLVDSMWSRAMRDIFISIEFDGAKSFMARFEEKFQEFYGDIIGDSSSPSMGIGIEFSDGFKFSDFWSDSSGDAQQLGFDQKMTGLKQLCDYLDQSITSNIDFSWFKQLKKCQSGVGSGKVGKYTQSIFNAVEYFFRTKLTSYPKEDNLCEDTVISGFLYAVKTKELGVDGDKSSFSVREDGENGSLYVTNKRVQVAFKLDDFEKYITGKDEDLQGYKITVTKKSSDIKVFGIHYDEFQIQIPKVQQKDSSGDGGWFYDTKGVELGNCSDPSVIQSSESNKSFKKILDLLKADLVGAKLELKQQLVADITLFLKANGVGLFCEDIKPNFFNSQKASVMAGGAAGGVLGVVGTMVGILVANSAVDLTVTAVTIAGTAISGGVLLAVAALVMALVGVLTARYRVCKKQCQGGGAQLPQPPQPPQFPLSGVSVVSLGPDHQAYLQA